jgi:hypothetical protein
MEVPAFFEPDKWLWIIGSAFCSALWGLVKYGHKWLAVILYHKREMIRINLKETAKKEDLERKIEWVVAKRAAKYKDKVRRKSKR